VLTFPSLPENLKMVSTDVSRPSYSQGSKKTAAEDLQDAQSTVHAQKKMEPRVSGTVEE
jgi:hypothetical protein